MGIEYEVFKGKNLAGLFKDIYENSIKNKKTIQSLVVELSGFIKTTQDAIAIIPSIKEFLEVDVKNDEQLVKLAKVVQQLSGQEKSIVDDETVSGDERQKILDEMRKKAGDEGGEIQQDNVDIQSQIDEISNNAQIPEA